MKFAAALFSLLILTSCYSVKIKFSDDPGILHEEYDKKFHYSVVGRSTHSVFLDEICPNGVAWVYHEHSFLNGVIKFFSLGIVSANEISVYCSSDFSNESKEKALEISDEK